MRNAIGHRGQALTETIIALPVFLIILFLILATIQASVVNEQLQRALRYGAFISSNAQPFDSWSFYSLYSDLAAEGSGYDMPAANCSPPPIGALYNTAPWPGPNSAALWTATTVSTPTCAQSLYVTAGQTRDLEFILTQSAIGATTNTESLLPFVPSNPFQLSASNEILTTPDLQTTIACHKDLAAAWKASLFPNYAAPAPGLGALPGPLPANGEQGTYGVTCATH